MKKHLLKSVGKAVIVTMVLALVCFGFYKVDITGKMILMVFVSIVTLTAVYYEQP